MRFDIDAEFAEDGRTIELISLGVVGEDGRTFYMENEDFDWTPILDGSHPSSEWLVANVRPHLSGGADAYPVSRIAEALVEFVGPDPEFWGWYADYDWIVVCQLFGTMMDLPAGWPMFCRDAKQLHVDLGSPVVPPHTGREHHSGDDSLHQQAVRLFLERRRPAALFYNEQWVRLLGVSLIEEVWARLDFERRFLDVSGVVLSDGARPWLRSKTPVAATTRTGVEVATPAPGAPDDMFMPGIAALGFEVDVDMDDMIAWAWGHVRADVVESLVEAIEAAVREKVAALFGHVKAEVTRDRAELGIAFDVGSDELMDLVLPNGVSVVYQARNLVVACTGGLGGAAFLAPDKERCVFRCSLNLCAALVLAAGRRLHAQAPGPVLVKPPAG